MSILPTDFVSSYIDAWNHHDAGGVAEHLARNGIYCDMPIQQQMSGDGLIAHLKDFFARDTNIYVLVGEVLTAENSIAFQYRACPAHGAESGDGWMGAEFITMDGDTANKIEDYYAQPGTESPAERPNGHANGMRVQRYAKSGLDAENIQAVMARLTGLMQTERVYLLPNLTLPELSQRLDCSVNHLSQVLNAGFGVGFFDYVNQYRVQEAIGLMASEEGETSQILNIALAVGFNSTSTFYAAFKKATGQTPAQYRRALANAADA